MIKRPYPGTKAAQKKGCVCPFMDNSEMKGLRPRRFIVRSSCPLHGFTAPKP